MPQTKEVHKEYMRNKRKGSQQGSQNTEVHKEGSQYPAIIYALADKDKRAKLERLCAILRARNLLREVRYGVRGTTFDVVGDFLDALRG